MGALKSWLRNLLSPASRFLRQAKSPPQGVDASDEFTRWLMLGNAGMVHPGNLSLLETAVRDAPAGGAMLEIGSFCGLSANLLAHYRRRHWRTEPLWTCDRWTFEGAEAGATMDTSGVTFDEYRTWVRDAFLRNVGLWSRGDLPRTIELTSDELFSAWDRGEEAADVWGRPQRLGGPLGFCYIDGNHTEAFARRDFENTDRYLMPGGYVLFDDSADDSQWEVRQVVAEVAASGRYELVAKNPNYLFRKR